MKPDTSHKPVVYERVNSGLFLLHFHETNGKIKKTMKTKKFCLTENQMPTQWYNIVADMPNKPLPPLHPATKQPVTKEQMSAIFAEELIDQETVSYTHLDVYKRQ